MRGRRRYSGKYPQTYIEFLLETKEAGTLQKLSQDDLKFLQEHEEWDKVNSEIAEDLAKYENTIAILTQDLRSIDDEACYPLGMRLHIILQTRGRLLGIPITINGLEITCNNKRTPFLLRPDWIQIEEDYDEFRRTRSMQKSAEKAARSRKLDDEIEGFAASGPGGDPPDLGQAQHADGGKQSSDERGENR